jgi:hypothetical protein
MSSIYRSTSAVALKFRQERERRIVQSAQITMHVALFAPFWSEITADSHLNAELTRSHTAIAAQIHMNQFIHDIPHSTADTMQSSLHQRGSDDVLRPDRTLMTR